MPEYLWPSATAGVSDTFWDHKNRTPPSVNPGTDITCGYGSPVYATRGGVVSGMSRTNTGSGGRYLQISNDNGTRSQYLHLSQHVLSIGDRVVQGQLVAISGASGFGSDWGYGPHLHKSLMINGSNVDFQQYSSPGNGGGNSVPAGGGSTPINKPLTGDDELMGDLPLSNAVAKHIETIVTDRATVPLTKAITDLANVVKVILANVSNDDDQLRAAVDKILDGIRRESRPRLYRITDPSDKRNGLIAARDIDQGYYREFKDPGELADAIGDQEVSPERPLDQTGKEFDEDTAKAKARLVEITTPAHPTLFDDKEK